MNWTDRETATGRQPLSQLVQIVADRFQSHAPLADGRPLAIIPDRGQIADAVLPLLFWCRERDPCTPRGLVGIAGAPGSGKTTFTAWLATAADALGFKEFGFIGLDGYHLTNAVLDSQSTTDLDGNVVTLRALKGTPETFDATQLLADLRTIRATRNEFFAPAYSRILHAPVPAAIRIAPAVKWLFVEGNFLFMDAIPWRSIRKLLDRKVYINVREDALRRRLANRHALAGRDAAWIEAHFRRTDGPNIRRVCRSARFADVQITLD